MNDFTKEELERILEGISWWLDGDDALYSEKLINKIQAMIDSYCEHEEVKVDEERPHIIFTCMECNKVIFGM